MKMIIIFIAMIVIGIIGSTVYDYTLYADDTQKILDNQNRILKNQDILINNQVQIYNLATNGIDNLSKKLDILVNIATSNTSELKLKN